jgi:serine/threonine protein kinase/predicted ATPase
VSGSPDLDTGIAGVSDITPVSLSFLSPALEPDELGRLAHYRILKILGQGGMGIVLLAEDTQLQRPVALKVIRPEIGQILGNRQRFLREARAMAQVRSDHVVTVHHVSQVNDVCYLAMELLEGEPLDRWLDGVRIPPVGEVTRIGREIAQALAAAHARGLVHRDVKPANIWLEAPARRVKLLDFGLARPQASDSELTSPGMVVGTPMYMAPEQALGEVVDNRADLFSLGGVLYRMATGRPPFEGQSALAIMSAVTTQTPPPAGDLNPALPAVLSELIGRLLARQPGDRPESADAVVHELHAIERAVPSAAHAHTQVSPGGPPDSRVDLLWSGALPQTRIESVETPAPSSSTPLATRLDERSPSASSLRQAREAERRQVTVLVGGWDLFESDAYLGLEPEDQAQTLHSFREVCDRAVGHFDGTILQSDEQGLLACFGYPVAHEDATRRAAEAGLRLVGDLAAPGRQLPAVEAKPWVVLHTGPAIVELRDGLVSLVGDARNVAVRLKDVAEPGQVICTENTHRLFRDQVQCSNVGDQKVRGVAKPVTLFRVERLADGSSGNVQLSPLTGRDHEISLLKDRWEQAQEGMGQVVFLTGEPGLGKSRLVHTLKDHVQGSMGEEEVDAPVIEWRCSPHYQHTGLRPAIDFYEKALGFRPEEPPSGRFDRLLSRVAKYGLDRPEVVPLWAALLSLPTPDRFQPLALSPARQREETFRLVLEWLHVRAAGRPVLFIVEDLHWADPSTLEFLGQFLAEFQDDRVLSVFTFRPEFTPPWPAASHHTTLSLTRLTRRQVADLVRKKAGAAVSDDVVEQVYDRAGGVPLFVEEFTKMVQEATGSDVVGTSGVRGRARLSHEIPSTLQDLVMARLDRMEGGRELAQLAAVLGREFTHELLAAIAPVDGPVLEAELARLAQADILYAKGRPPRCTYTFKHALLEDALYNALVKGKRQQYHRRVAEVLETKFRQTAETQPELLGHHFTEAGLTEKAVEYWLRAGQRSRDRSAFEEAIGHLSRGLELVHTLPESPARDGLELRFLTGLGPAFIAARGYAAPEVGPALVRALDECRRIGDQRLLFGIMLGMWEWHIVRADLRACVGQAADGMALAESQGDAGMVMEALFMPGVTQFYRGQFADARVHFESGLRAYDDRARTKFWTAYTGHDGGVTHRCYLALTLWHLGFPDQARNLAREACELARTIGHPFSLEHAVDFAAFLALYCRLGSEAQALGEEEMAIAIEQGFPFWHALGTLHKGAGLLQQYRTEEALPHLQKGLAAFRTTGAEIRVPAYLGMLGDAYTQLGRFDDAHRALDEALAVAEKNENRSHEAELHRLRGELILAKTPDRTSEAKSCFSRSIETARAQQSKGWELRAATSLARIGHRTTNNDDATAALAAILESFTEGFTTADLSEARSVLGSAQKP